MKAVDNIPEDIPCHAHTNERMAYRAELKVIRKTAQPADGRWLPMLRTTELEEQELRRVEMERIALHDFIITASRVPKLSPEVVADVGYSSVYDYLKLRVVDRA